MSDPYIRQEIVREAESWIGTPWQHRQHCKGVGVDCVQLIGYIGLHCGLLSEKQLETVPQYSDQWHLHKNEERLLDTLKNFGFLPVEKSKVQPGDILTFSYGRVASHTGIYLGNDMVLHAPRTTPGKVEKLHMELGMHTRIRSCFQYPGLI